MIPTTCPDLGAAAPVRMCHFPSNWGGKHYRYLLAGKELQQAAASCKRAALKEKLPGSAKAEGPAPEWNAYKNKMVTMQQRRSRDQEVSVLHTT